MKFSFNGCFSALERYKHLPIDEITDFNRYFFIISVIVYYKSNSFVQIIPINHKYFFYTDKKVHQHLITS